ncbi:MAG: hypothetical protein HC877_11785 [Thioploca sp.]|nr:hypothetical protein [Thioploca sp.]
MAEKQTFLIRDGISQQMRLKVALQPGYVAIDERLLRDLLAFMCNYSQELRYFNENNQEDGDWSAFFPFPPEATEQELDKVIAFIQNPDSLPPEDRKRYQQPHFVLLLSFLQLLEPVRQQLNGLTQRHLDFYFREILHLREKRALPDHVHILVELTKQQETFQLPAGTLLQAGKDDVGKVRVYRTDEDALLNQARIAKLGAIYIDKRIIGIRETHLDPENKNLSNKALFLKMLEIALGEPLPGDPLPKYPDQTSATAVNLEELYEKLKFVHNKLKMSFFRFGELMKFKNRREGNDSIEEDANQKFNEDWAFINDVIEQAGKCFQRDSYIRPKEIEINNFSENFSSALDLDPYAEKPLLGFLIYRPLMS